MIQKKLLLVLILFTCSVSAQIKGVVQDSLSGKPIPFVNIWVENENIGSTSEENGSFSLDAKQGKMQIFSALGYETKKMSSTNEVVFLKPVVYELKEIVLERPKFNKQIKVGNYESSGFRIGLGNINSAVIFNPGDVLLQYPFLKEIKFQTKSDIEGAKIRIKFLILNSDNSPGISLLEKEIIVVVKKGKNENIVDLKKHKFKIPTEGFFISFEKLLIDDNKYFYELSYKDKEGKKVTSKQMYVEPELCFVPEDKDIVWQSSINGKWTKTKKHFLKNPKSYENLLMRKYHDKYLAPSMLITLTN